MIIPLILLGKCLSWLTKRLSLGNGSTWPGHIALKLDKHFIRHILGTSSVKVIFVVGTNGKTTTSKILTALLKTRTQHVFHNTSGANLMNGIASTLLQHASFWGKLQDGYAVFEIDEFNLPLTLEEIEPDAIIVLNLFRDQLDRYGELDTIAQRWHDAFLKLPPSTTLILNADDPLIAYLGHDIPNRICYFGLREKNKKTVLSHAADSIYCPRCHYKLTYDAVFYSHLGKWHCDSCELQRPKTDIGEVPYFPFYGTYNKYNTLASVAYAQKEHISDDSIEKALRSILPAFGRQETVHYQKKKIQIFLSKNPTGFNESLRTIRELNAKIILLVLNDRIPDGRDVSWIWDVDFEDYIETFDHIVVSGDRVYDMALRLQYASSCHSRALPAGRQENENPGENPEINSIDEQGSQSMIHGSWFEKKIIIVEDLEKAIEKAIELTPKKETLYMLPTYSAMLEIRNIIVGRKIL